MNRLPLYVLLLFATSCEDVFFQSDPQNDPTTNFDILWTTLEERYSFFEYKQVDWDSVYAVYRPKIQQDMAEEALWQVMTEMLDVLEDGHVNLRSEFDIHFWNWYKNAPVNFDKDLLERNYWGDYEITGSLRNTIIDSVGYIYYPSFQLLVSDEQLDYLADKFKDTKGLILDIRNNDGGNPVNGWLIAERFIDQRRHIYTNIYKNGPEPGNFTSPYQSFLAPKGKKIADKVVVLTNRKTYSAGNFFAASMKAFPNVTIVGDTTGGGGGAPVGWELPNGWHFNFSSSITYLPDGFIIEKGVAPDIKVDLLDADRNNNTDTILEKALSLF
jgi:hypothetical protein